MSRRKMTLLVLAFIFGVLAVVLYFVSKKDVPGMNLQVANIQGTVFCAACAIICALNIVGFIILSVCEELQESVSAATYEKVEKEAQKRYSNDNKNDDKNNTEASDQDDNGRSRFNSYFDYWVCNNCKWCNPIKISTCEKCGHKRM